MKKIIMVTMTVLLVAGCGEKIKLTTKENKAKLIKLVLKKAKKSYPRI